MESEGSKEKSFNLTDKELLISGSISNKDLDNILSNIDKSLSKLTLSSKKLTSKQYLQIFESISHLTSFKSIQISNNKKLSDDLFEAISKLIENNQKLKKINLSNINLTDQNFEILVKSLKTCTSLKTINLKENDLSENSLKLLLSLVKENTSITSLLIDKTYKNSPILTQIYATLNRTDEIKLPKNVMKWKIINSYIFKGISPITCILYCKDKVWAGTRDGIIYVWNPSSSSEDSIDSIETFDENTRETKRRINGMIEGDDNTIWCITDDRCITIISTKKIKVIDRIPLHTHQAISICRYGDFIYMGGTTGEISKWDIKTYSCIHTIVLNDRHPVSSIYADEDYLWVGTVVLPKRNSYILVFSRKLELISPWEAHTEIVTSITPYMGNIVTSSFDGTIKVWDISKYRENKNPKDEKLNKELFRLDSFKDSISTHICCNKTIIACGKDEHIILWSPYRSKPLSKISGGDSKVTTIHKIDNYNFITADKGGRITIWNKVAKSSNI